MTWMIDHLQGPLYAFHKKKPLELIHVSPTIRSHEGPTQLYKFRSFLLGKESGFSLGLFTPGPRIPVTFLKVCLGRDSLLLKMVHH